MTKEITFDDVSDEEAPVSAVRRTQALGQFINVLQASWESDVAKGMNVDEEVAASASNRFRAAATELGMGVSIATIPAGQPYGANGNTVPEGMVRLVVQAKEKRQYTPRKASNSAKKSGGKTSKK